MTAGLIVLAFLAGFLCGLLVKVGRAEREQDVQDVIDAIRRPKP